MLHGPIGSKIMQFALPLAATGILQQLFNASIPFVYNQCFFWGHWTARRFRMVLFLKFFSPAAERVRQQRGVVETMVSCHFFANEVGFYKILFFVL